jgi:phage head maturation protease
MKDGRPIKDILVPGCFDSRAGEVMVFADHDRKKFVGLGRLSSNPHELSAELLLDSDVMERLNSLGGTFTGCSPSYTVDQEQWISEDTRRILKATLKEISLTNSPAFEQSSVQGMPHIAAPPRPAPQPRADQHPRWAGGIGFNFKPATPEQKHFYQWTLQQASQRRN